MSAIGHLLELQGLATVSISLVREHTERIRPPRALWVPFELGRPFGAPDDPDQQIRILTAALSLLGREDGPVILADSDESIEPPTSAGAQDDSGLFCMLPIAPTQETEDPIKAEFDALMPWYQLAVQNNGGRTTVGVSPFSVGQALQFARDLAEGRQPDTADGQDLAQTLRFASEDLRNWYLEAAQARPGSDRSSLAAANWFWGETLAGKLMLRLKSKCLNHPDKAVRLVANKLIVPRAQAHR